MKRQLRKTEEGKQKKNKEMKDRIVLTLLSTDIKCIIFLPSLPQNSRYGCNDDWPGWTHSCRPSPPHCTFLSCPAESSPGRAVCCSGSHQMSVHHLGTGQSLCSNRLDCTPRWSKEPEPGEPPLCPETHTHWVIQDKWFPLLFNVDKIQRKLNQSYRNWMTSKL